MTSQYLIYGLIDPRTKQLRYVGQSTKGEKRPIEHWTSKRCLKAKDHCHTWIRSLLSIGLRPEYFVLEEIFGFDDNRNIQAQLDDSEIFWIAYFKMLGCDLTNSTRGGCGTLGMVPWCKGKNLSVDHKRKIGEGNKGKMIPQWMRDLASRIHKGKIESEETKRKKSESHKGIIFSEEHRRNISLMNKGRHHHHPKVLLSCFQCREPIELINSDRRLKNKHVFCSIECTGKYWKGRSIGKR